MIRWQWYFVEGQNGGKGEGTWRDEKRMRRTKMRSSTNTQDDKRKDAFFVSHCRNLLGGGAPLTHGGGTPHAWDWQSYSHHTQLKLHIFFNFLAAGGPTSSQVSTLGPLTR